MDLESKFNFDCFPYRFAFPGTPNGEGHWYVSDDNIHPECEESLPWPFLTLFAVSSTLSVITMISNVFQATRLSTLILQNYGKSPRLHPYQDMWASIDKLWVQVNNRFHAGIFWASLMVLMIVWIRFWPHGASCVFTLVLGLPYVCINIWWELLTKLLCGSQSDILPSEVFSRAPLYGYRQPWRTATRGRNGQSFAARDLEEPEEPLPEDVLSSGPAPILPSAKSVEITSTEAEEKE